MRKAIGFISTIGLVAIAGCSTASQSSDSMQVSGSISIDSYYAAIGGSGDDCDGEGGYSDITAGARVTIRDLTGKELAFGSLDSGSVEVDDAANGSCVFKFTVDDVPAGEDDPYSVEVSHRGEVPFDALEASDLALTV